MATRVPSGENAGVLPHDPREIDLPLRTTCRSVEETELAEIGDCDPQAIV